MKKYIILSVNDNVDYLYFTPLTCWAWRKFGWEPILFYHRKVRHPDITEHTKGLGQIEQLTADFGGNELLKIEFLDNIEGYRSDTITQISRLYGSCVADGYLMTGDIDMLPLSDYWQPDFNKVTVWGHDLTGFRHFPICYIGAPSLLWSKVMRIPSRGTENETTNYNKFIKRDLDSLPQAKSTDFYTYWYTDQDLITERLREYSTGKLDLVTRGQGSHGYARGRVDRGHNGWELNQPTLIDCHMQQQTHHKQEKVDRLLNLLHHVWPTENFDWFIKYTEEFRKLDNKTA